MELQSHWVAELKDFPNHAHFAVLISEERNYPDSYGGTLKETYFRYVWFETKEALNDFVLSNAQLQYGIKTYRTIYVNPVEIKLHTTFEIKE